MCISGSMSTQHGGMIQVAAPAARLPGRAPPRQSPLRFATHHSKVSKARSLIRCTHSSLDTLRALFCRCPA